MWTLKTGGKSYYIKNLDSRCSFSTKETPLNEHTKGSIKFKNCYLSIDNDNAIIWRESETANSASAETDEILGSTPGRASILRNKLYIITNNSIPIGYQAAQACHALHEWETLYKEEYKMFLQDPTIVILSCNENKLKDIYSQSLRRKLPIADWKEPALNNQLTSICLYPDKDVLRELKKLKLLGN